MNEVYLLLGSNIDKEVNLPTAVRLLHAMSTVAAVSAVYETAPMGTTDQPAFFNAAVCLHTPHTAVQIKHGPITEIEQQLNRVRTTDKNAPRTIDLDIVLFNRETFTYLGRDIPDPDILHFPHTAVPLADIAPDYVHPTDGRTLRTIADELYAAAGGKDAIRPRPDVMLTPQPTT